MSTVTPSEPVSSPPGGWRLWLTRLRTGAGALLLLVLGVALVGHLTRDRHVILAFGFLLPLLPLGLLAVLVDLIAAGRALPKGRFLLSLLGLLAAAWGFSQQWNFAAPPPVERPRPTIKVLQWNVRWGGKPFTPEGWETMRSQIVEHRPDVAVYSEAPFAGTKLLEDLSREQGWHLARTGAEPGEPYVYQLAVISRWPVLVEEDHAIPNGHMTLFRVQRSGRDLRVLVVDLESNPWTHLRQPSLEAVMALLTRLDNDGTPVDFVAGDFNAPGRSVAFDAMPQAGYVSAGRWVRGWRATWPAHGPLYDIDHVWVQRALTVQSCEMLASPYTDHRGHLVTVQP